MQSVKEIKKILHEVISLYNFTFSATTIPASVAGQAPIAGHHLDNADSVRKITNLLKDTGLFKKEIDYVLKSSIFKFNSKSLNIDNAEFHTLFEHIKNIERLSKELLVILDTVIPDENPNSIDIKLPADVTNLNDLSHISRDLHLAISQIIINDEVNGDEKIASVENGSIWLNIFLGSSSAVALIGRTLWAAAVISKKRAEVKLFEAQAHAYEIANLKNEDLADALKKQIDLLMRTEAELIQTEHFKEDPAAYLSRIEHSIKLLSDMIDRGAEFKPSISAPETVANLFPSMKNLTGIESRTKKLTEGN